MFREIVRYSPPSIHLALLNTIAKFSGACQRVYRESLQSRKTRVRTTFVPDTHIPSYEMSKIKIFSFSSTERMAVDKVAANRFIKHAIAQAVRVQGQSSQSIDQEPTPGPSKIQVQPVPTGAASKMLARAEWEKQVREAVEEEEEDLEVFDEAEDCADAGADVETTDKKTSASTSLPVGKGETETSSGQRPGMSTS